MKPRIALTIGDPAGVGPEVIAGAWADPRCHAAAELFVVGPADILQQAIRLRGTETQTVLLTGPTDARLREASPRVMPVLDQGFDDLRELPPPHSAAGGEVAYRAVRRATELALSGEVDAVVTAPLSKSALHAAGHKYPGHTELLAELCGVTDFAMMLYLPPGVANASPAGLGVVHVTLHMALAEVFQHLTTAAIEEKIALAHSALRYLGCDAPRVGVAALNPHGGEAGLFGDEEIMRIAPAVAAMRERGIDVQGPYPADTLLLNASRGEFDAVVAMYHDQGHIALKLLAMHQAVNVTLGLPIVRSSVAHGTAYDRAWQGVAETSGMVAAIETAARLVRERVRIGAC